MWAPLMAVQDMRVWLHLGGVNNTVLHGYMSADFGYASMNMPVV